MKGTLVTTTRGLLPIEQLQVADEVYTFDLELKDMTVQKITKIVEAQREKILVLDFGDEKIRCTPPHRFYTGRWIAAAELTPGDTVFCLDGRWKPLLAVQQETQLQPVFNLVVEQIHNHFVGHLALLVHNKKITAQALQVTAELMTLRRDEIIAIESLPAPLPISVQEVR